LDALRGIAALAVVLFHLTHRYDEFGLSPISVSWGHVGVELFFVISGFVILMTAERATSLWEFIASRVARLYPVFWPAVILTAAVAALTEGQRPWLMEVAANLTMVPLYLGHLYIDNSYWTLQIEIPFYIAVGTILLFGGIKTIEIWCAVWLVAATAFRLSGMSHDDPWESATALYYGQFFIIGITLYRFVRGQAGSFTLVLLVGACLYSLLGVSRMTHWDPMTYFFITVALTGLCWAAVTHRLPFLLSAPLLWLGAISYPLYLVHQRIGVNVMHVAHRHGVPGWACTLLAIGSVIVLAWILHITFETPGRRLFRRLLMREPVRVPNPQIAGP
jgi:peptidoglycan/LPS O-acetylase OafA/YrhL